MGPSPSRDHPVRCTLCSICSMWTQGQEVHLWGLYYLQRSWTSERSHWRVVNTSQSWLIKYSLQKPEAVASQRACKRKREREPSVEYVTGWRDCPHNPDSRASSLTPIILWPLCIPQRTVGQIRTLSTAPLSAVTIYSYPPPCPGVLHPWTENRNPHVQTSFL